METAVETEAAPAINSKVSNGEVNGELERTDSVEEEAASAPKPKRQTYKYSDPPILFTDVDVSIKIDAPRIRRLPSFES